MQRQALNFLRGLGSRLRAQPDEAVLRTPRFAREINPEPLEEPKPVDIHPRPVNDDSHERASSGLGERRQEGRLSTSYDLPDLRADVEQQRYPVSALLTLVTWPCFHLAFLLVMSSCTDGCSFRTCAPHSKVGVQRLALHAETTRAA